MYLFTSRIYLQILLNFDLYFYEKYIYYIVYSLIKFFCHNMYKGEYPLEKILVVPLTSSELVI